MTKGSTTKKQTESSGKMTLAKQELENQRKAVFSNSQKLKEKTFKALKQNAEKQKGVKFTDV
jgi:hypothetical protein